MGLIISALELGGIYAVMALGIYITYKILDFPDLTVDGSFPLGGAITAVMIQNGTPFGVAMIVSVFAGAVAGMLTGIIHVKFKIRDLLSGIIMMTGLYSVNYMIAGKANLPIIGKMNTVFSNNIIRTLFGTASDTGAPLHAIRPYRNIIVLIIVLAIMKILLDLFLNTKRGYLLKAMGDNPMVVATLGKNGGNAKIMGLSIANAFVAFSGSLFCQYMRAFNLTDGTGKMVIGLASVIIGINIFGRIKILRSTTSVIIGSVVYTACVSLALSKFDSDVKNLVTALLFFVILVIGGKSFSAKPFAGKKSDKNA